MFDYQISRFLFCERFSKIIVFFDVTKFQNEGLPMVQIQTDLIYFRGRGNSGTKFGASLYYLMKFPSIQ